MLKCRNENSDNGCNGKDGTGNSTDGTSKVRNRSGTSGNLYSELSDALCQGGEPLHGRTDAGDALAEDHKEGTESRHEQTYLQDDLPCAFVHVVELVDKSLYLADDIPDSGHQHFTERNSQLLQLRFQNGELTAEVVLHDRRHLFGGTVTVGDGVIELVDVSGSGIHNSKKAGHGILADKCLRRRCRFGFCHLREISTEVTEDVSQLTHGAVSVCRGNGDFSECRAG